VSVPLSVIPVNDLISFNATLSNLAVYEDSEPMTLHRVFQDVDNNLRQVSATSSNENLVSVSVTQSADMTLTFGENLSGTAVLTLHAESEDDSTLTQEIVVVVLPVDDGPFVINAVSDQSILEDSSPMSLDVSNVFEDVDSVIESVQVFGNSNPNILTVEMSGDYLVMTPLQDKFGFSDITIRALSQSKSAFNTFRVIVNSVDDPPRVIEEIPDQVLWNPVRV